MSADGPSQRNNASVTRISHRHLVVSYFQINIYWESLKSAQSDWLQRGRGDANDINWPDSGIVGDDLIAELLTLSEPRQSLQY